MVYIWKITIDCLWHTFIVSFFIIKVGSFKTFCSYWEGNFGWFFQMFSIVYKSIICLHWYSDFGILTCHHLSYYLLYIIVPYMDYRTWNHLQFWQLCLPWISFSAVYIFYLPAYSSFQILPYTSSFSVDLQFILQVSGSYAYLTFRHLPFCI